MERKVIDEIKGKIDKLENLTPEKKEAFLHALVDIKEEKDSTGPGSQMPMDY